MYHSYVDAGDAHQGLQLFSMDPRIHTQTGQQMMLYENKWRQWSTRELAFLWETHGHVHVPLEDSANYTETP